MKKVGIVTIQSLNFGNRLQNYALQEGIRKLGFDVYSFRRYNEHLSAKEKIKDLAKKGLQYLVAGKILNFRSFDKNIRFSKDKIGVNYAPDKLSSSYDYFVAGSEQIWNPFFDDCGKCDYLSFAGDEKRISYAASFGISRFPTAKRQQYSNELKKFKAISVREEEGSQIVKELIGETAEVVLDPTFLLSTDEWKKVEKYTSEAPKEKYCLVYSLKQRSEAFNKKIELLSKEYTIVDIMKKNSLRISKRIGPGEFLYLISHADIVLTNSFHATVFSILYEKAIYTFARIDADMNSRIKTLANILHLQNNFDEEGTFSITCEEDRNIAKRNIEIEKDKSIGFLKRALDVD